MCSLVYFLCIFVFRPEYLAKEVLKVIKFAPNGTSWVIEGGEPAYEYSLPDRTTMKQNALPTE